VEIIYLGGLQLKVSCLEGEQRYYISESNYPLEELLDWKDSHPVDFFILPEPGLKPPAL
jgi:hypothetical protein